MRQPLQYETYKFLSYAFRMTPGERLRAARIRAGFKSASTAAAAFGWVKATYLSHENGWRGLRPSTAKRYARAFGVDFAWLLSEESPELAARPIEVVEIAAAAGGGAEAGGEKVLGLRWFSREWLDRNGLDPTRCAVIRVRGESMEPTLPDGCAILFDRNRQKIREDGIYVVERDGALIVKRAGKRLGRWRLVSDHPAIKSEPWPRKSTPIGEVVWMARTLIGSVAARRSQTDQAVDDGVETLRQAAKEAVRGMVIKAARAHQMVTDKKLREGSPEPVRPYVEKRLGSLLNEIAAEEDEAGRGLLTAVVVRDKVHTPGAAFFALAARRGRDVAEPMKAWKYELSEVFRIWAKREPSELGEA